MRILFYFFLSVLFFQSCSIKEFKSDSVPVQHGLWDSLLHEHVSESGVVDYFGFQKDSIRLNKYIALLSGSHPNDKNWSSDERLAYWINAYNAFTVKLMVDNYPIASIKDIKNGIPFVNSVWDIKFINIEGANYDLNNIEHSIVRSEFSDPRIHAALNCASISCPRLRSAAYIPQKLDDQLDDQMRYFLKNEVKNQISDPQHAKLSKLFSWYSGDFKKKSGTVINFINEYSDVKLDPDADIQYLDYLWGANDK